MTGTGINTQAAVEVAKSAAGILPEAGKAVVLEHLLSQMAPEALKALSPEVREKLLQALTGTEAAPSATTSAAGGRIETVDGHQAVVGQITVNGQQLDTLLSEGSFNKYRSDQHEYAVKLGYRMATREEHGAYVEGLLAKEDNKTINEAEQNALKTYRERYVRDTQGGLDVDGRRVFGFDDYWDDDGVPDNGALFVRASAESN
jgi:ABC-type enterochelin transport system ATPase subunit